MGINIGKPAKRKGARRFADDESCVMTDWTASKKVGAASPARTAQAAAIRSIACCSCGLSAFCACAGSQRGPTAQVPPRSLCAEQHRLYIPLELRRGVFKGRPALFRSVSNPSQDLFKAGNHMPARPTGVESATVAFLQGLQHGGAFLRRRFHDGTVRRQWSISR